MHIWYMTETQTNNREERQMSKKDVVYKVVTASLIAALESAIENDEAAPWDKPWTMTDGQAPMSIRKWMNGKTYRGINVWILMGSGRPGPWITFNQAKKAGGRIKSDETKNYTTICFWKLNKYADRDDPDKERMVPMLRYYRVYSLEQTEGIPEKRWMKKEQEAREAAQNNPDVIVNPFDKAEEIWINFKDKPEVRDGGNRACYSPFLDYIQMPTKEQFTSKHADAEEAFGHYFSTLFHEGAHATGHPTRCGRFEKNQADHIFGTESYSKEELVAEMCAAYLQAFAGIEVKKVRDNNVAYLKNWIKKLENDPRFAVQAASQAQKACDHILGIKWEDKKENEADAS
jgi:antirestriction protein ArdC